MPDLKKRDPHHDAERGVDEPAPHVRGPHDEHRDEHCDRHGKCAHGEMVRVDGRDDHERDEVVDDDDREDERAQPVREPRPDDREHAERERRVGRHRRAPAVRGRVPGVNAR